MFDPCITHQDKSTLRCYKLRSVFSFQCNSGRDRIADLVESGAFALHLQVRVTLGGLHLGVAQHLADGSLLAKSTYQSSAAGFIIESRLAAFSAGMPIRILRTGISIFLPVRV